ncbi:MAG: hypothetical protein PUI81_01485 [Veillonellaceae bacterium]|nr:hypothetical protein [Veillonellaceae bacterium]
MYLEFNTDNDDELLHSDNLEVADNVRGILAQVKWTLQHRAEDGHEMFNNDGSLDVQYADDYWQNKNAWTMWAYMLDQRDLDPMTTYALEVDSENALRDAYNKLSQEEQEDIWREALKCGAIYDVDYDPDEDGEDEVAAREKITFEYTTLGRLLYQMCQKVAVNEENMVCTPSIGHAKK